MPAPAAAPFSSVLLLGPTGAGKTPLGDWLAQRGLWGRRCHHFDFGANLRAVVTAGPSDAFPGVEIQLLKDVLERGALLEHESFFIAEKILDQFVTLRGVPPADLLVLNGLPRHVGQAVALAPRWRMRAVIQLECDAATVQERLRLDSGGDRSERTDDDAALVARKLATFTERTRPLVDYYQRAGALIIPVPVRVATRPAQIHPRLERRRPDWLEG